MFAHLSDPRLLIYVEGFTSGYGGGLQIERSPDKSLPPRFNVYAVPGNMGINPKAGPKHVPVFTAATFSAGGIADEIVVVDAAGGKTIAVDRAQAEEPGSQNTPDWIAIHNLMPGTPGMLRVAGMLETPRPGYSVELKKAIPQGISPTILLLNLVVGSPDGYGITLVTPVFPNRPSSTAGRSRSSRDVVIDVEEVQ